MFDCKQVIFAQRQQTIFEGQPIVTKIGDNNELHHGDSKCTALIYHEADEHSSRERVVAYFEDNCIRTIFDIDEIMGFETEPEWRPIHGTESYQPGRWPQNILKNAPVDAHGDRQVVFAGVVVRSYHFKKASRNEP